MAELPYMECSHPTCREMLRGGGRCDLHKKKQRNQVREKKYDDLRGSASSRGYGVRWRGIRASYLARYPFCQQGGCIDDAEHVHHMVKKRDGGSDYFSNLQGLCEKHHNSLTAQGK